MLDKARDRLRESPWQVDLLRAEHLFQTEPSTSGTTAAQQAAAQLQAAEACYAKDPRFWVQLCLAYQVPKLPA